MHGARQDLENPTTPGSTYQYFFIFFIITIIEYVIFLRIIVLSITYTDMGIYFNCHFMNPVGQTEGPQFLIPRPNQPSTLNQTRPDYHEHL